jgi:hypothetical protein
MREFSILSNDRLLSSAWLRKVDIASCKAELFEGGGYSLGSVDVEKNMNDHIREMAPHLELLS